MIQESFQTNMCNWRKDADPMDMLQAFVAALAGYYDEEFPKQMQTNMCKDPMDMLQAFVAKMKSFQTKRQAMSEP